MNRIYSGLDVCKYIAACLIVVLHVVEIDNVFAVGVVYTCTRFAVPFFFISSGFLFHMGISRSKDPRKYLKKYLRRIAVLFAFWGVLVYGAFTIRDYFFVQSENGFIKNLFLTVRRIFLIGPSQTWYLLSLILSIIVIYYFNKAAKAKGVIILVAVCFVVSFLYTNAENLGLEIAPIRWINKAINTVYSNGNNFIVTGIPFTGLGFIIAHYRVKIKGHISVALFCAFSFLSLLEYLLLVNNGKTLTISFAFQAVFFFFIAVNVQRILVHSKDYRNASTVTYLLHWLLLYEIINPILNLLGINPLQLYLLPIKTIIAIIVCLIVCLIVSKIDNKRLHILFGI